MGCRNGENQCKGQYDSSLGHNPMGRLENFSYKEELDDSDSDTNDDFVGDFGSDAHRSHCKRSPSCVHFLMEYNMLANTFKYTDLA